MRVLQIIPYFAPAWSYGGPPRVVYELSKALVRRGHSVTVLTTDAYSSKARTDLSCQPTEVNVHYAPNLSNTLAWRYHAFLPLGTGRFLREHIAEFDILHVHMYRTLQNVIALKHSRWSQVPYVFSAHGSIPRVFRGVAVKRLFDAIVGNEFLRRAASVIAVSDAERTQCLDFGLPSHKIHIVYNGVDASLYESLPRRGLFVERQRIANSRIVLYVGRLNHRKGLEVLVRSFAKLTTKFQDAHLAFVGPDDGMKGRLERLVRDFSLQTRVTFAGFLPFDEKLEALVDSELVVYPGSDEVFGLVPFEALLCNRPVIVADDSGCGELVRRTKSGLTFRAGDPDSLLKAMESVLQGSWQIDDTLARGRNFVLKELGWSKIALKVEDIYEQVSAER